MGLSAACAIANSTRGRFSRLTVVRCGMGILPMSGDSQRSMGILPMSDSSPGPCGMGVSPMGLMSVPIAYRRHRTLQATRHGEDARATWGKQPPTGKMPVPRGASSHPRARCPCYSGSPPFSICQTSPPSPDLLASLFPFFVTHYPLPITHYPSPVTRQRSIANRTSHPASHSSSLVTRHSPLVTFPV